MLAQKKNGFTLIELLVVIAIIAILSTVGMVVYSSVQKNARISKRVQDLNSIKTALETFKTATGFYPAAATAGTFACISTPLAGLVPNYMPALPADPLDGSNVAGTNCYEYTANATTNATEYKLRTKSSIYGTNGEMNSANFSTQPNLLDPVKDGTVDCIVQTGGSITYQGWAIYSGGNATCQY